MFNRPPIDFKFEQIKFDGKIIGKSKSILEREQKKIVLMSTENLSNLMQIQKKGMFSLTTYWVNCHLELTVP